MGSIDKLKISKYFKSFTFSDQVKCSKPNYKIFQHAHEKILYTKENILHIGDNIVTDGEGSTNYGFNHRIVNSNEFNSILTIIEYLYNINLLKEL